MTLPGILAALVLWAAWLALSVLELLVNATRRKP